MSASHPSARATAAALVTALFLLWRAAPVWAAPAPPPDPGPSFPGADEIANAFLSGLGRALTAWLTGPDLRGEAATMAGDFTEWALRQLWAALAWAFGGVNIFTALPPAWTTELPAVQLARARLVPVATAVVGLGTVLAILLAGLGTLIGRPFGWLYGRLGSVLLATAGLAVAPQLVAWFFGFCNALSGALLDPFSGLPGLEQLSAAGQYLQVGWVALLYAVFAIVFLFQRIKLVVIAALCSAVAPLALAAGALPFPLAGRFFQWWITTTVSLGLVHVLQAVCLGIGANVLLVGGGASEGGQDTMAGLVAAGSLLAAGTVPGLLLRGLAAAAGPSALLGHVLHTAAFLAGVGLAGTVAGGVAGGAARFAWPGALPSVSSWTSSASPQGGYVRSLLAGSPAGGVPMLPPPKP